MALTSVAMDLTTYVRSAPGVATRLARDLDITPVLISQWVKGEQDRRKRRTKKPQGRPVPEDRAPAIEWHTGFQVLVETLCPYTRWHRVPDQAWPLGKPLIDKTPARPVAALFVAPPAASAAVTEQPGQV